MTTVCLGDGNFSKETVLFAVAKFLVFEDDGATEEEVEVDVTTAFKGVLGALVVVMGCTGEERRCRNTATPDVVADDDAVLRIPLLRGVWLA